MRIRGVVLADYVKIVRATRDRDWESFLTAEDWEIVNSMVIPTKWYPVETMGRIGRGLYMLLSGESYDFIRSWSRQTSPELFDPATQKFLDKNDPAASLHVFARIASPYVDEIDATLEKEGPGYAEVTFYPVDTAPTWDCYREVQAGAIEWIVEFNGGKNPATELDSETRDGREACIIKVTWEE